MLMMKRGLSLAWLEHDDGTKEVEQYTMSYQEDMEHH